MSNSPHPQRPTPRRPAPSGLLGMWARLRRWLGIA